MTLIKQVDSRAVCVEVKGIGPLQIQRPYSMHPTGWLQPNRADMRWENGVLVKLAVSGDRLRKDGSVGLATSTTHFVYYGIVVQSDIPGWLKELVAEYDPIKAELRTQ